MPEKLPEGTVTVLFTDVVGSTSLTTGRGDEAARDILRAQSGLVRQQIEEHGGHEVKTLGDGFMVAFASARKAVACAIGIQRALDDYGRRHLAQQPQVRIGLNVGEVIREEEDIFGAAVNAAARIAARASGSQILVSETVKTLVGQAKDVEFLDRGRLSLKGFPERWRLFEVAWQDKDAPTAAPVLTGRTPFVGREAECAELTPFLDRASKGHGALVMIGGEPGVGKTRLTEEMLAEAARRGFRTITGHCYEVEGAPPYAPFLEMLEIGARTVERDVFRAALGDAAPDVARIMPELRRLFPEIPPPLELPPEQERRCLLNGVREFIERAGYVMPMVLLLDDLHWADESTLLLLQHVAQELQKMPVLIIGTYRDVELDVNRPLARALETLMRQRLAHRVSLRRLPEGGVSAMLRALGAQEPPSALVQVIYSETEGNPFFVEEVFRHLAEEGKLFDTTGNWRPDLTVSELDVPEGVRLVVGRRLERIGEDGRRALSSAAVIGRVFTFELLESLGDLDADVLLDALDQAESAHLVTPVGDGPEARYTFSHELIRQTLLSGLSLPRRQRLHLRVAEALERTHADSLDDVAPELAHHLYQASGAAANLAKASRYMAQAGQRAQAAAAFEDALGHFEKALQLHPAGDRGGRADLLYNRGLALRSLGRWEEALADWGEALTTYEERNAVDIVGRMSADVSVQLMWAGRFLESLEVARRGLIALGDRLDADRCRLLSMAALTLSAAGQHVLAGGMFRQALDIAEELGDNHLIGYVLGYMALNDWAHMKMHEAVDHGRRAAELLRQANDLWALADVLWAVGYSLPFIGRFNDVDRVCEELEPLAIRLGHVGALVLCWRDRAHAKLAQTGDLPEFQTITRRALDLGRDTTFGWYCNDFAFLGLAELWSGNWHAVIAPLEEAARLEPPGFFEGGNSGLLALAAATIGDEERAMAALDGKRHLLPVAGRANTFGSWTMLFAVVQGLAALGKRDEAAALYPMVLEGITTGVLLHYPGAGLLQTVAGIAAACSRQWEKAEEHFETALRQAHELPVVLDQPEARRWYAWMLLDRDAPGDREKARGLLTEAIDMYGKIGMPKHMELACTLLSKLTG